MKRRRSSLFIKIFSLPFLAFGIWSLFSIAMDLSLWFESGGWDRVPAQILHLELKRFSSSKGAPTHKVVAHYRYEWKGVPQEATRVSLRTTSDNVGDHQRKLHQRLKHAKERGASVKAWVDPDDPTRSLLDRELRGEMLVFNGIFVLVFGGFGLGVWLWPVIAGLWKEKRRKKQLPPSAPPWEYWSQEGIPPRLKKLTIIMLLFTIAWSSLAFTIPILIFSTKGIPEGPEWLVMLFPTVGLGLWSWLILTWLRQRVCGPSLAFLHPFPGALGGDVRGHVQYRKHHRPRQGFDVSLLCLQHVKRRCGSKTNYATQTLWESTQRIDGLQGSDLPFSFSCPTDLPESQKREGWEGVEWSLRVQARLPGVDLDQSFEIPVFKTEWSRDLTREQILEERAEQPRDEERTQELLESLGLRFERRVSGWSCRGGIRLRLAQAIAQGIFGVVFTAIGVGIWMAGAPVFGGIFGFVGLLMPIGVIDALFNHSHFEIDRRGIRGKGSWWTKAYDLPLDELGDYEEKMVSQTGKTKSYHLYAQTPNHGRVLIFRLLPQETSLEAMKRWIYHQR